MKQMLFFASILLAAASSSWSQAPDISLLKNLGCDDSTGNAVPIGMDASGSIYLAMNARSNAIVGNDSLHNGVASPILFKFSGSGTLVWARPIPVYGVSDIEVNKQGDVYMTGIFFQSTALGMFALNASIGYFGPAASRPGNVFAAKWNTSGTVVWAKNIFRTADSVSALVYSGLRFALDSQNNMVVTGGFSGKGIIGNDTLMSGPLNNVQSNEPDNSFLVKISDAGNLLWARCPKGNSLDMVLA